MGEGLAFMCEKCDGDAHWRLDRRGDAAVSWACDDDLADVAFGMQRRRSTEVTELVIRYTPTLIQHAELDRAFAEILSAPDTEGEGT